MEAQLKGPVTGPAVWTGPSIRSEPAWKHQLTSGEITELRAAVASARASGLPLYEMTREHFALPTLAPVIARWVADLMGGRGFVLVRGLPVFDMTPDEIEVAYWALGRHMGEPAPQTRGGDLLGHVRDTGELAANPKVRLYKTTKRQDFHADGADVVGLLCLRKARSGGISQIVSSASLYNEVIRRRPDLLDTLYEPLWWDRGGEYLPGESPTMVLPICSVKNGALRVFYIGWYIRDGQQYPEVPRLTPQQVDMLEIIEATANDPAFYLDMDFEPGDIQFLNNSRILHCRTEYEDFDEPDRKRHLLRLWLNIPAGRPPA